MQTSILDQWNRAEHTVLVIENNTDQFNSGGSLYRPVLISNSKQCFSLPSPAFWWNKGIPAPTQPTLFLFRALSGLQGAVAFQLGSRQLPCGCLSSSGDLGLRGEDCERTFSWLSCH